MSFVGNPAAACRKRIFPSVDGMLYAWFACSVSLLSLGGIDHEPFEYVPVSAGFVVVRIFIVPAACTVTPSFLG